LSGLIARTATLLKKERGVAVVACGDPAGVSAEKATGHPRRRMKMPNFRIRTNVALGRDLV